MTTPTVKAIQMIGMTPRDMEREDFFKRSGRKAAAALRSLGYSRKRFPTYAGNAVTCWAANCADDEFRPAIGFPESQAFYVLVIAIAQRG